jgi:hypothetical protein
MNYKLDTLRREAQNTLENFKARGSSRDGVDEERYQLALKGLELHVRQLGELSRSEEVELRIKED